MLGALDRFFSLQAHHVEKISERLKPVPADQTGQFAAQSSDVGCRPRRIAERYLRNLKMTNSAGLGTGHSAIPDQTWLALLSSVAVAKVERAIGYIRQNFWPLCSFADLADINAQTRQWLKEVANQRQHRETGQKPEERFQPESLRPLRRSPGHW